MSLDKEKKVIRESLLAKRAELDKIKKRAYDRWVCEQLFIKIKERNAKVVHAYLTMGTEINITPLLQNLLSNNITVVTPKTLPKRVLENRILHSLAEIEKGVFGTTHPAQADVYTGPYDFVIIPGLAFDDANNRLGYGGAYYDTFLAQQPTAFKQGILYPFQKIVTVPTEAHDIKLDHILVNEAIF